MTAPRIYEFANIGTSFDGKPLLLQIGNGRRTDYPLRFATVRAESERAARRIQVQWRQSK